MQKANEKKRLAIVNAATELFASCPYESVRLDEIAERAHVGKGTVYVYFKNKEDLYGSVILEGFSQLLARIQACADLKTSSAWETLSQMVLELTRWAVQTPDLFRLLRESERTLRFPGLREQRRILGSLLEQTIRLGVKNGEFSDPHPEFTAQFIPACVRGVLLHGPSGVTERELTEHILRVIGFGIQTR